MFKYIDLEIVSLAVSLSGKVVPDVQVANPTKSKDAAKKPVSATKPKVTLVDPKKEESHEEEDSDDSDEELNDDVKFPNPLLFNLFLLYD